MHRIRVDGTNKERLQISCNPKIAVMLKYKLYRAVIRSTAFYGSLYI